MNTCCKIELRKAMQNQRDVAMTITMAHVLLEALWNSQWDVSGAGETLTCAYDCGARESDHNPNCKFVAAWNCEEMQYLRYSLGINHDVQVKQ